MLRKTQGKIVLQIAGTLREKVKGERIVIWFHYPDDVERLLG